MEFNKKVEKFGMFGLTFEIRKDKKTKCRFIFCQNVMIINADMNLGYIKDTRTWTKLEIMEAFSTKCVKTGMGKEQILKYVSK